MFELVAAIEDRYDLVLDDGIVAGACTLHDLYDAVVAVSGEAPRAQSPSRFGSCHLELGCVEASDYPTLRRWASLPETGLSWRYRGATPSPANFETDLWAGVLVQFAIRGREDSELIGVVSVFDADFRHGHGHLGVMLGPDHVRAGWPWDTVGLTIEHTFAAFELHKLYAQVSADVYARVESMNGILFDVEARLADHEFRYGAWHESILLAIHRERWFDTANAHRTSLLSRAALPIAEQHLPRADTPGNHTEERT